MPLHIIRQDITKLECDAIVNAANNTLLGGGGVDGAIHKVAGSKLLEECKTLGGCDTGDAKITKGYNLPSKYVIHTVGPIWCGGQKGEKLLLESCYKKSLALAKENGCETVAFPLISSGVYGYPKDKALEVATSVIREFLFKNEMTVYLLIFDKTSYKISNEIYYGVREYIDDNYVALKSDKVLYRRAPIISYDRVCDCIREDVLEDCCLLPTFPTEDGFVVTLLKLIDKKGITDVECYKKANVSKQTWYKIMNNKNYNPSKNTVISFAIALELSLKETKHLLSTVGFTLSKSIKFDVIIEYFIVNEIYDIFTINETLFKFDQVCLGV